MINNITYINTKDLSIQYINTFKTIWIQPDRKTLKNLTIYNKISKYMKSI